MKHISHRLRLAVWEAGERDTLRQACPHAQPIDAVQSSVSGSFNISRTPCLSIFSLRDFLVYSRSRRYPPNGHSLLRARRLHGADAAAGATNGSTRSTSERGRGASYQAEATRRTRPSRLSRRSRPVNRKAPFGCDARIVALLLWSLWSPTNRPRRCGYLIFSTGGRRLPTARRTVWIVA